MTATFEQMWADLAPVGRSATSGGYFRQPFGTAERECHAWFVEQCHSRGLRVEHDGNGNTVGWWDPPNGSDENRVLTGSHLDSVLDGGAFDGPLGIASGLAAIDLLRDRGFVPHRAIGVAAFVEEEGSRFSVACLGSRLATGSLTPEQARDLSDRNGTFLLDAMSAGGLEPQLGPSALLNNVGCYVELHVEQGRDLIHRDRPVGLASMMWPHGRYRFDFTGEANHAGATALADRHDPMLTYAATALIAREVATALTRANSDGARATFARLDVSPNATNAIADRVTAWLDARCATEEQLAALVADIERSGKRQAANDGTNLTVTAESVSPAVRFDSELTMRLAALQHQTPVIASAAGHDAAVLAAAGIASAMIFVRNPTGVSHSPAEHAERADCLAGVDVLAQALEVLAR